MKEEIQSLIEIVDEEVEEFRKFLASLIRQADHLSMGDFSSFEESVSLQQEVSERLSLLEQRRQEATSLLARRLDRDDEDLDFATVAQLVEVSQSTRLRELYGTLLGLCFRIEEARATNDLLIQESMELIRKSSSPLDVDLLPEVEGATPLKPEYEVAGMMN